MKYIFSLLLIFSFNISFGQMTVSEMMRVYKMDLDQFETYSISKGFQFLEVTSNENYFGHKYGKGPGKNTKYLTLYTNFFKHGKYLTYQTSNSNEYLNFKNDLKSKGFIVSSTKSFEGSIEKIYMLNKWEFTIYTGSGGKDHQIFEIDLGQL
jgi:hypothetical protein